MEMNISELELKMMAKEATAAYLDKKVPMDDTITKMASSKSLNPHQVARVCEAANLGTYHSLWDKTGSGDFTFEHADQDKVAEKMAAKFSPLIDEYTSDIGLKDLIPDDKEVKKIKKDQDIAKEEKKAAYEKTAEALNAPVPPSVTTIKKLAGKLTHYIAEVNSALFESTIRSKEAAIKLKDAIKIAALSGENIAKVQVAAIIAFPTKKAEIRSIMMTALEGLDKHGIEFSKHAKTYSEDAQGNRSEDLNSVNKNHPVLKHISTILDENELSPRLENSKQYMVKKVEILNSKLTSKKFDNA
jgi:hypothetical protein